VWAHPLVNLRGVTLYPPPDGRMIHREAALAHSLLEVSVRELVAAIPSNAQKDDRRLEVSPLERRLMLLHKDHSWGVMAELKCEL